MILYSANLMLSKIFRKSFSIDKLSICSKENKLEMYLSVRGAYIECKQVRNKDVWSTFSTQWHRICMCIELLVKLNCIEDWINCRATKNLQHSKLISTESILQMDKWAFDRRKKCRTMHLHALHWTTADGLLVNVISIDKYSRMKFKTAKSCVETGDWTADTVYTNTVIPSYTRTHTAKRKIERVSEWERQKREEKKPEVREVFFYMSSWTCLSWSECKCAKGRA